MFVCFSLSSFLLKIDLLGRDFRYVDLLNEDQDEIHQQTFCYKIDTTKVFVQVEFYEFRVDKKSLVTDENDNPTEFEFDADEKSVEES